MRRAYLWSLKEGTQGLSAGLSLSTMRSASTSLKEGTQGLSAGLSLSTMR
eukprot:CAMPEP_0113971818 /NCGR_PEP_ID=MMETSP0011_2-20120614/12683_1 /TAXON_ID=101924 /ORGANISM="Rhodosorus marinus" /LENGTH=49 /DNA_ID=CAMNT_0000987827 /DNA_START=1 /DNA_END=150 /DNA_ORIENTATION=+ /assembly_acc=CAM_ASM_000156